MCSRRAGTWGRGRGGSLRVTRRHHCVIPESGHLGTGERRVTGAVNRAPFPWGQRLPELVSGGKVLQLHIPARCTTTTRGTTPPAQPGFRQRGAVTRPTVPCYFSVPETWNVTLDLSHRHRPRSAGEEGADAQADAEEEERGILIRRS